MATSSGVKNVMINRPPRASQELTDAEVQAFASQAFIQESLKKPTEPKHVLSFFFGEDFIHGKTTKDKMRSGDCLKTMPKFWFQARNSSCYDQLCSKFSDLVHKAGTKALKGSTTWNDTVDGKIAQMILCDQLARNIWRGTKEAYAYEAIAKDISRELAIALVSSAPTIPEMPTLGPSVDGLDHGEVYPPYLAFILVALMHSEVIEDHDLCDELFQLAIETTQPHLHVYFEGEQKVAREHRVVLEAFGRYPYRNAVLGRKTTPEEAAWLAKKENMPDWAKSQ